MFWHSLLAKWPASPPALPGQSTRATGRWVGEGTYSCRASLILLHWAVSHTTQGTPRPVGRGFHHSTGLWLCFSTQPHVHRRAVTRHALFPAVVPGSVLTVPLAAWARAPSYLLSPTPDAPRALDRNRGNRHTHLSYSKQSPPNHSSAFSRHTLTTVLTTHSQCLTLLPFTMRGATPTHSCLLTRQTLLQYFTR